MILFQTIIKLTTKLLSAFKVTIYPDAAFTVCQPCPTNPQVYQDRSQPPFSWSLRPRSAPILESPLGFGLLIQPKVFAVHSFYQAKCLYWPCLQSSRFSREQYQDV